MCVRAMLIKISAPKGPLCQQKKERSVGQEVSVRYKDKRIKGVVKSKLLKKGMHKQLLEIKFDDRYAVTCAPKKAKRWLVKTNTRHIFKQIDHILVSNRWRSSITNCKVHWSPSLHRSKWNVKQDQALVCCSWKW